jgi:Fic family protein
MSRYYKPRVAVGRLAKCSQDTAYRDILDLTERGVLKKNPEGGRSTSYDLADI